MLNEKVTNIKNIRKSHIPYIITWTIFYSWLIVFFTWWITSFKNSYIFKNSNAYLLYLLFSIFIATLAFVLKPKNFRVHVVLGGLLSILILVLYNTLPFGKHIIYLLSFTIALTYVGLIQIFIYILNNTEKFYSVLFANFLMISVAVLQNLGILNISITKNYSFTIIVLLLSFIPVYKFNKEDYLNEEKIYAKNKTKTPKMLYFSLILNLIFLIFCRGIGRAYLLTANDLYPFNIEIYYYFGGMLGCLLLYLIFKYVKKANSIAWNIIFSCYVFAIFLFFASDIEQITYIFAFILGNCVTMGMCLMYYTLGIISKKYWDFKYIRYNIFIIDIIGCGLGTIIGNYIYSHTNYYFNIIVLSASVLISIILLSLSPILILTFFEDKWDEDSTKAVIDNANMRKFTKLNLTKKEIEVCKYILENLTVRQIAAEMKISENTIKFHKKQIFEKLNINSKEELIKIIEKK